MLAKLTHLAVVLNFIILFADMLIWSMAYGMYFADMEHGVWHVISIVCFNIVRQYHSAFIRAHPPPFHHTQPLPPPHLIANNLAAPLMAAH
jgi:hypothetical protein